MHTPLHFRRRLLGGFGLAGLLATIVVVGTQAHAAPAHAERQARSHSSPAPTPPLLVSHFSLLRNAHTADTAPASIVALAARIGGMLTADARLAVTQADGTQFWLLPGEEQSCMVVVSTKPAVPLRAACRSVAAFAASGIQDALSGTVSGSQPLLVGMLPDAYRRVVLTSRVGEPLSVVPVTNNVYVAPAQVGDTITATDSQGHTLTQQVSAAATQP